MFTLDATELREAGVPQAMIGFVQWALNQDTETVGTLMAAVNVLSAYEAGQVLFFVPGCGMTLTVLMAECAARDLRDLAARAGFAEAAALIEQQRLEIVSG